MRNRFETDFYSAMFSFEKHNIYRIDEHEAYGFDLWQTYGSDFEVIDWTTLVNLQRANPSAFARFAKSLGRDDAFVLYNGAEFDGDDNKYVVRTFTTATTVASISTNLYLDVDIESYGRTAYRNFAPSSFAFNTVASVRVVVP